MSYARVKHVCAVCVCLDALAAHRCIQGLSRLQQAEDQTGGLSLTIVIERPSNREAGTRPVRHRALSKRCPGISAVDGEPSEGFERVLGDGQRGGRLRRLVDGRRQHLVGAWGTSNSSPTEPTASTRAVLGAAPSLPAPSDRSDMALSDGGYCDPGTRSIKL